jgi:DHA1 family bicyclomycin/chloramphenicol resistance-like MFS transporter
VLLGLALADADKWLIIAGFYVVLASNGFIAANALAGALSVDPLRAGTTSGLFGAANFALGGIASAVVAAFHNSTAVPVASAILIALTAAAISYYALAKPPRRG